MRLRWRDFESLEEAADIAAAFPTQLARIFIVNGPQRLLYEHRRQHGPGRHADQASDDDAAL